MACSLDFRFFQSKVQIRLGSSHDHYLVNIEMTTYTNLNGAGHTRCETSDGLHNGNLKLTHYQSNRRYLRIFGRRRHKTRDGCGGGLITISKQAFITLRDKKRKDFEIAPPHMEHGTGRFFHFVF